MNLLITKPTLTVLLLVALFQTVKAQKRYPTKEEYMKGKVMVGNTIIDTANASPGQMELYRKSVRLNELVKEHYYFNWLGRQDLGIRFQASSKSNIYEGLKQPNNGREFTSVLIDGTTPVEIIDQSIDSKEKAETFLYRVVKNNNEELLGWTKPTDIRASANGTVRYAYLGKFNYSPNQILKIEIYNTRKFSDQDAVFIDWRPVVPAKVFGNLQYTTNWLPDNGLTSKFMTDLQQTTEKYFKMVDGKGVVSERPISVKDFIETTSKDDIRFRADDSVQNISFDIGKGDLLYNYKVSLKRTVDGKTDSINLGENNARFNLYKEFWKSPGKYKVTFTPKIYKPGGSPIKLLRGKATSISFTVLPALNQESVVSVKFFLLILVILLSTAGFMFFMYRDNQRRKLAKAAQNRQIATLQLQAVRSRLNPHFIFNALAGIQNLMNKNEVENANKYLSKFAKLTRNVLDDSDKELTPIEHEIELLNDYLLMEQMRFGFQFGIEVDPDEIDQQVEIPAMLMQPFVENAVKHGVSALKDRGKITVSIAKAGTTLVLAVRDNGKGFALSPTNGMGIKLCNERISLLNSIYKQSHIMLRHLTDAKGTLITIELQNWI